MNTVLYFFSWLMQTFFRLFPIPTKTRLITLGTPDSESPVFLTCNFLLTVQRVQRALQGMNCYLLVANSHGINIWCASAGGHFTHHSVISALKTSGIENLVTHRRVILPQLAATGVEAKMIKEKTGWTITWGPVDAKEIKPFMLLKQLKTDKMRDVTFSLFHRIEMAIFWALPISLLLSIGVFFFLPHLLLFTNLLVWGSCLLLLLSYPLYKGILEKEKQALQKPRILFSQIIIQIILFLLITGGLFIFHIFSGRTIELIVLQNLFLREIILTIIIVFFISIDLKGLTPVLYSGFLDKGYRIQHNTAACKGDGVCLEVCPRHCFIRIKEKPLIALSSPETCINCGACIVQCRYDALMFIGAK